MEERANRSEGYFDLEKLLIDKEIVNPFGEEEHPRQIYEHLYETKREKGYIRYVIEGKTMIILDCVITETK